MSGAHRMERHLSEDSDISGSWRERLEQTITLKSLLLAMDHWLEQSPAAEPDDDLIDLCSRKAHALLGADREPIQSGKALHDRIGGLARRYAGFAEAKARFETMIAATLLGRLELNHLTASELECLRTIVVEPVARLGNALAAEERDNWQVIEALCFIMDSRIYNEKDIVTKLDNMKVAPFDLTQKLLRRLLWDQLEYAQFRRVVYAFYIRLSSRRSKLGYGDFEHGEMLSYVYDFGSRSSVVYEFMTWKAANPIQLTPAFEQALVRYFDFEGRGALKNGKIRRTLLSSNNKAFNELIRGIWLEQSGIMTRFFHKYGLKLLFSLALGAAAALGGIFIFKHWIE
ncbi:hypothetical protein [Cohnella panacarvi]|uniref:hypothetical protein n=1 Tax=Cohnella panacarvi TaxID=400776 RepID=UPI0004B0E47B|nr:hypothetical protein [Cohnella panacarvi]